MTESDNSPRRIATLPFLWCPATDCRCYHHMSDIGRSEPVTKNTHTCTSEMIKFLYQRMLDAGRSEPDTQKYTYIRNDQSVISLYV